MKKLRSIPAPDFNWWPSLLLATLFFLSSYSCFSQDTLSLEESIKRRSDVYLRGTRLQHLSMEERQQKSKKLVEQSQFIIRGVIDKQEKVDYSEKLENGGVVNYQIVPFHINQVYKGNVGNDTLVWLKLPINESHNGSVYYYDLIIGKGTECVIFCKPVEINLEEKNIKSIFELKERNRFSTITSFPNAPIWVGLYGQVFKSSEDLDSFFLLKKSNYSARLRAG